MSNNSIMVEKNYKVVNGTSYDSRTPDKLIALLEKLIVSRERIILEYGDVVTGQVWKGAAPAAGTLGRSGGNSKIPLLIRTSRSLGGEAILDGCILRVLRSKGKEVLYP